ncbi:hypothetical protein AALB_2969 [Agarivorans albus MKT 106]|uniref:Uncharacterized protein n=1 Tax=Agarivorans albus MKT 106 TaxID=1331007 RepID=R9PNG8_AGAAL|nr:hypothetical protein [Agarivorans albus]GAD02889.1 hypothetical protein AALB_2969 [Agarivorans albus MKT 106]
MQLGSENPQIVLYLNTQVPSLPISYQDLKGAELSQAILENNNNNWRKVLTIFAKLCAPDEDWRSYLHQDLLLKQQINFKQVLVKSAQIHVVAGKANWQRFDTAVVEKSAINQKKLDLFKAKYFVYPLPRLPTIP